MDPARAEALKLWLLRALVNPGPEDDAAIDSFSSDDWDLIARCAGQHRLRPLLSVLARTRWADHAVPDRLRSQWQRAYDRALKRQFEARGLLKQVTETLTAAGIDYAVLKGGAMLGGVYADAATRPIRDLDILVRPAEADRASQVVIGQCGCVPISQITGAPLEDFSVHKHVEPLRHEASGLSVELHVRLVDRPRRGAGGLLFDADALLARAAPRRLGGRAINCLAWPESLLHLIAHGIHDHQLNNGPLLLTDALAIATKAEVDWDEFWALADAGGWTGAARLTNDLLVWLTGSDSALFGAPPGPPTPEPVLRAAAHLLLQDRSRDEGVSGWSRLQVRPSLSALLGRARMLWRRRASAGVQTNAARPAAKFGAMLRALTDPASRSEIARSGAVYRWIAERDDAA